MSKNIVRSVFIGSRNNLDSWTIEIHEARNQRIFWRVKLLNHRQGWMMTTLPFTKLSEAEAAFDSLRKEIVTIDAAPL